MCRTFEHGTRAMLSFSGGPHSPVNTVGRMEEVNVSGTKKAGNGTFAVLYCAIFHMPRVCKSLGLQPPLWIQKQLNYQHYPYYPPCLQVTCGPPEKLSLAHSAHDCETHLYLFNDFLWNCLRHRCINKARQDSIASNTMSVINEIKHMSIRQAVSNEKFQWLRRKQGK